MSMYTPLDPTRREIRVLHIAPGQPEDDIACQLVTVSLDVSLHYNALIYMGGYERPPPGPSRRRPDYRHG